MVDGAASKATAARLAASPSAASACDGSQTGLRAAFANGAKPSVAARVRASLEGELRRENAAGPRSTRARDQVFQALIHVAGTIRVTGGPVFPSHCLAFARQSAQPLRSRGAQTLPSRPNRTPNVAIRTARAIDCRKEHFDLPFHPPVPACLRTSTAGFRRTCRRRRPPSWSRTCDCQEEHPP